MLWSFTIPSLPGYPGRTSEMKFATYLLDGPVPYLDVEPKKRGVYPPKWMVYSGNPIKMDDLGVPLFLETPICQHN